MVKVTERATPEVEAARVEAEIAQVCGVINAATGPLVELIARVLQTDSCAGLGRPLGRAVGGVEVLRVAVAGPVAGDHGPAAG